MKLDVCNSMSIIPSEHYHIDGRVAFVIARGVSGYYIYNIGAGPIYAYMNTTREQLIKLGGIDTGIFPPFKDLEGIKLAILVMYENYKRLEN